MIKMQDTRSEKEVALFFNLSEDWGDIEFWEISDFEDKSWSLQGVKNEIFIS